MFYRKHTTWTKIRRGKMKLVEPGKITKEFISNVVKTSSLNLGSYETPIKKNKGEEWKKWLKKKKQAKDKKMDQSGEVVYRGGTKTENPTSPVVSNINYMNGDQINI